MPARLASYALATKPIPTSMGKASWCNPLDYWYGLRLHDSAGRGWWAINTQQILR